MAKHRVAPWIRKSFLGVALVLAIALALTPAVLTDPVGRWNPFTSHGTREWDKFVAKEVITDPPGPPDHPGPPPRGDLPNPLAP
jgi:hypothetical protein